MKTNKIFVKASIVTLIICISIILILWSLYKQSNVHIYNYLIFIVSLLIGFIAFMIMLFYSIVLMKVSKINTKSKVIYIFTRKIVFPILSCVVKIFKMDQAQFERFYIEFNNSVISVNKRKYENNDMIIVLPHCLQDQLCGIRITNNINNCKKCGKCNIKDLVELTEKWGIKAIVVTGGSAARTEIVKLNPKAVISVACERDLASGIRDVNNIPVIGILNRRPYGPCINTRVDIDEVEKAIITLMNNNENNCTENIEVQDEKRVES